MMDKKRENEILCMIEKGFCDKRIADELQCDISEVESISRFKNVEITIGMNGMKQLAIEAGLIQPIY